MKIRRINLYGGACSGKSFTAAGLFYRLKGDKTKVELVSEYIKEMAYEGRKPISFDPLTIFAMQLRFEDTRLRYMPYIISDSPLMLQVFYSKKYKFLSWDKLYGLACDWESLYSSLNIFLDREGLEYQQEGRYETYAEAVENDHLMMDFLDDYDIPYKTIETLDFEGILAYVKENLS